jgi:hypothetical protein
MFHEVTYRNATQSASVSTRELRGTCQKYVLSQWTIANPQIKDVTLGNPL